MPAEYVRFHYPSGEDTVPLRSRDELGDLLRRYGACTRYEIRPAWWYRPLVWLRVQKTWLFPSR
jgi:hypothetical protein